MTEEQKKEAVRIIDDLKRSFEDIAACSTNYEVWPEDIQEEINDLNKLEKMILGDEEKDKRND
ncbi:MAG TPA: hypothetical protein VGA67_05525 [Candidatus Dojkabacteria bacterium]